MSAPLSKPIRTVLRWQLVATAVLGLISGVLADVQGALSAVLGGTVSLCAGWASAKVAATMRKGETAGGVLITALKAEGVKLGVMAVLLWVAMTAYREMVVPAFLGTFVVTFLVFSMAILVRDDKKS